MLRVELRARARALGARFYVGPRRARSSHDDAEEGGRAPRPPLALLTFGDAVGLRRRLSAPATPPGHVPMDGAPRDTIASASPRASPRALVHRATFIERARTCDAFFDDTVASAYRVFRRVHEPQRRGRSRGVVRGPEGRFRDRLRRPAASDQDLKVDLHALDRAKAEIDRLHLERQIKEAVSAWNKAVQAWESFKSMGPTSPPVCACLTRSGSRRPGQLVTLQGGCYYWAGTKLLWVEIKIATRLLFKTLRSDP